MLDLFTIPVLPAHESHFGAVALQWEEIAPGYALVTTKGGSPDTKYLASYLLRTELENCGYLTERVEMPSFMQKIASWNEVMEKAVRLYSGGNVELMRNGYENVVARVKGDHGTYMVEFDRQDPSSRVITQSTCLLADAKILLATGKIKTIDKIKKGDKVVTHDGTGKVTETMKRTYRGELLRVFANGFDKPLEITPEHPIWIFKNIMASGEWTKASKVQEGDYVASPINDKDLPTGFTLHKVNDIESTTHEGYVYNFSVSPQESYVADNVIVHNCTCPWNQYRWLRTRQWKKYEGRVCAHILAAYWASLNTPLDEDVHPATQYGQNPQQSLIPQQSPPGTATYPQEATPADDFRTLHQDEPWAQAQQPSQSPPYINPDLIPMQQQDFADMNEEWNKQLQEYLKGQPISIPSEIGPYPGSPLQQKGTLSSLTKPTLAYIILADDLSGNGAPSQVQFQQGDTVRINVETTAQKEGPLQAEDAGEWVTIPRNSQGEVFDVEPTSGFISVVFPLPGPPMSVPYPSLSNMARSYMTANELSLVSRGDLATPFIQAPNK